MFMFGQMNQAEYEKLVADGWDIIRSPSKSEVDKFCDPAMWHGATDLTEELEGDDFFVLIAYDYDVSEVCKNILKQRLKEELSLSASMERDRKAKLDEDRTNAADEAFENYDFHAGDGDGAIPEGATIEDFNGWETSGDRKLRTVFYLCPDEDSTSTLTFVVTFKNKSADIDDTYMNY